jgi:dolichol-phosphate mannosyltransferase
MDADFLINPTDLENCTMLAGYRFSIGSRYVTGVNVVNWPLNRVVIIFASVYVRIITGMKIHDDATADLLLKKELLGILGSIK